MRLTRCLMILNNINKKYKLDFETGKNTTCLCLSNDQQVIRKWHGQFAKLILKKLKISTIPSTHLIHFDKQQVHQFFVDMTCLYQSAMCHYGIDKDLIGHQFDNQKLNIAKSLLLQIRMHDQHPKRETLLEYYLNEFDQFDDSLFDKTLLLLSEKKLIQSIITEDGSHYFDKNPKPHDHIYFTEHKKLIDCPSEIASILSSIPLENGKQTSCGQVFYMNHS